jgi:hypothetical protein
VRNPPRFMPALHSSIEKRLTIFVVEVSLCSPVQWHIQL